MYKSQWGFLFLVLYESHIFEMVSFLVDAAGVSKSGDGGRRADPPPKRGASGRSRLGAPGGICEKSEWRNSRRLANPKDSLPYYCNISEDIPIIAIFG